MLTIAFLPMPCRFLISSSVKRLKSSAVLMPAPRNALRAGWASLNGGMAGVLLMPALPGADGTL